MKRNIETPVIETVVSLPIDVIMYISKIDNWIMSGPIARTSKTTLRAFTEKSVLREILNHIKRTGEPMFKWLLFALPSYFISNITPPTNRVVRPYIDEVYKQVEHRYAEEWFDHCLVSGGVVCQSLYNVEWKSDLDLFIPLIGVPSERERVCYDKQEIDLVTKQFTSGEIQRSLDTFDLSIVQQGFVNDVFYQTPVALYTFLWQEIVAMPDDVNMQYNISWDATRQIFYPEPREHCVNIWQYIERHDNDERDDPCPYHECKKCHPVRDQGLDIVGAMTVWADRVLKYARRFSSFSFAYCKPPGR